MPALLLRLALFGLVAQSAGLGGCQVEPEPSPERPAAHAPIDYLEVSFEALYPVFLQRKSMSPGEKSSAWNAYRGRWVRWEGVLVSLTPKGVTLKQLRTTMTYDVSLICDAVTLKGLKARYMPGDRVRYFGRLEGYDDIFRTMYLRNGGLLEKVPHGDLGVPFDLSRPTDAY